jgi:TRAP-type C4-dicarboxylate transport system permease small subunit
MSPTLSALLRGLTILVAALLLLAGCVLGYIAVIALRRNEGVFLPAGYVALACLVGGTLMCRVALRW